MPVYTTNNTDSKYVIDSIERSWQVHNQNRPLSQKWIDHTLKNCQDLNDKIIEDLI